MDSVKINGTFYLNDLIITNTYEYIHINDLYKLNIVDDYLNQQKLVLGEKTFV